MYVEMLCLDSTAVRAIDGKSRRLRSRLAARNETFQGPIDTVEKYLDSMVENNLHEDKINHPYALKPILDIEQNTPNNHFGK